MSKRADASTTDGASGASPRRRWPFILAGIGATVVTLVRTIGGGRGDLPRIVGALDDRAIASVVYINWYALSIAFGSLAVALFSSVRMAPQAARLAGILAAVVFGATAALFMHHSNIATGSPFTFFPWIPLSATAALSALAAWRA